MTDKSQFVSHGEENNPDCVVSTVKHPSYIMVWFIINSRSTGRLQIVQGTLKQEQYKNILEAHLLPQLSEWFHHDEKPIFMQDEAPCHKDSDQILRGK